MVLFSSLARASHPLGSLTIDVGIVQLASAEGLAAASVTSRHLCIYIVWCRQLPEESEEPDISMTMILDWSKLCIRGKGAITKASMLVSAQVEAVPTTVIGMENLSLNSTDSPALPRRTGELPGCNVQLFGPVPRTEARTVEFVYGNLLPPARVYGKVSLP